MRFRKRLSAAIMAIVMMLSSIQIPGGTSYAAGLADVSMESGVDASILTAEETEDAGMSESEEGALTDGDSHPGGASQPGGGNVADNDSQPGNDNASEDDSQSGGDNQPGDGSQPGDDNPMGDDNAAGDDSQTSDGSQSDDGEPIDDWNNPEQEADVEQEIDIELEPNEKIVSYSIEGISPFADMPEELEGRLSSGTYNYYGEVFDYVYRQMMQHVEYIDLYEGECLEIEDWEYTWLMVEMRSCHPELWFVKDEYELVLERVQDGGANVWSGAWHVKAIIVHYYENGEEYDFDAFDEKVREALSCVNDNMSDVEKVAALHDWLALNCRYDLSGPHCDNAYGALVDGRAVCSGYALAYRHLMDMIGIESYYVVSEALDHGWNMVKLNDQYYHVDVTWDDSYGDGGYVEHDCLLFSENHPGGHRDWTVHDGYNNRMTIVDYKATDTTYDNAFWRGLLYPLFYGGGECYYISKGKLMKASLSNVSKPGVEIADGEFSEHSGLLKINDRLYYNGEYAIYSIKTDGTDNRTEFTQDPSEQYYMSGLWNNQGKIYYKTSKGWLPSDIEPDINNSGEYWIMYRLNGGMNDSGNPGSYNSETETITLKAPTKEGYVFTGWYTDIHLNYKVTEIPKGSTGNITLFAGWRPETDNPAYTFTTVDGQTVSSVADGSQKVLIFFDMTVGIYERTTARRMLMDLREHIGAFDGVDFYAIEISGKSSDEVAEFKEKYGCGEITFCYDSDGSNKAYAEEYTNGNKSNLTVVIIDAKNRVQRVTNEMSRSWTGILKDLQEYCGYDNWYILYELDYYAENHSGNPYIYQYGADDVILEEPFKGGYMFEGWYKDETFTQQVTEIANDSRENFKLYAKWRKGEEGLDEFVENYSFTSLDGMKFNTKTEGRPKLIVFYDDAADESAAVIREISGINYDLGWVDICAIDIGQNSKSREKVRLFADTYGCDGITFSYNVINGTLNKECMESYLETAGIEASTTALPVICYIDALNNFQWITLGMVSAEDILGNLKKYCLYLPRGEGEYKITYELDGGKNNRENPMFYMPGTRDFILRDPFKVGHTFEGWYKDADFKEKITKIAGESTGDITIYAKWSVGVGIGYENYDIPFTALDGTTFSTKAEGRPRVVIFYDVAKDDSASTVRSIAGNISVLDGVDIYAVNVNKGPVNGEFFKEGILDRDLVSQFKDDNGCDGITFSYMSCGSEWLSYRDYMRAYTTRAGYNGTVDTPVICYIDSKDNLQWVSLGKATVVDVLSCLKNSCDYGFDEGDIYGVNYRMDGGTNDWRNPVVYLAGTQTIALRDPVKEGYTFEGWYEDPEFSVQVNQIAEGSTGDITFYARWKKGAPNPDYTFTTVDDETVSSKADGKPKLLFFFRQDSPKSQEMSLDLSKHIKNFNGVDIYAIEAVNAKKEVVAQYKNVYGCDEITFCYDTSGKNMQCYYDYFDIARFSSEAVVPFTVYIDSQNRVQHGDLGKSTFMEVLTDLRDYCDYHYEDSEVIYNITYELNGVTDDSANPGTYTPGTETIVLKDAVKDGYTFEGWYNDAGFSEKVTEIVKGSTGDITLYAKWKEIPVEPTYRIIYELGGGTNSSENPATYMATTETITLADAVREGYKFKGWYKDSGYTQKVTQIPKGSTGDIKLYAKWLKKQEGLGIANLDKMFTALDDTILSSRADGRPKLLIFTCKVDERDTYASSTVESISQSISDFAGVDIYVIDYDLNSKEYVSNYKTAYGCDEMKFAYDTTNGTRSIVVDYLKAAGKQTLWTTPPVICYIDEYDILQCITQGRLNAETILNNLDIYCDYTPEECNPLPAGTYKITYKLNGGTNSSENPATYTAETETITLKDAVREGFIFEGWYKDAGFNEQVTQIVKGNTGNITLYAKWRAETASDDPDDRESGTYKVTFDVQGHGTAPKTLEDIKAGSTIDSPTEPKAEGYRFDGWYKDAACSKPWDFEMDIVQSDLTLYAKWLSISSDSEFVVQEIANVYYTGKVQKPAVSVYDKNTLLKAGKDYTVKYYNNINANKNGGLKGEVFNAELPYVEITGKGNYKETVKINFNILRVPVGAGYNPAAGVTLKMNDQLVKANKEQKPFGSLKYGRNLKEGTDYELELRIVSARDGYGINATGTCNGAKVPADYTGEFMLTVTGIGNYSGSISRKVYVADKAHLMKNVKITLGKDLKNIPYTGSGIELTAVAKAKPANGEFVVTYGKTVLNPGVDYDVSYNNNVGVGKAELVVTGKNGYAGSKSAIFNIKGKTFTNGTVEVNGLVEKVYTGRAIVQNENVVLTWKADGTKLVYGRDYTVSYSKNINKGTATMTFIGKAKAGYSGRISKKFKIGAADIADVSKVRRAETMQAISLPYSKAGMKPVDEIILTNEKGTRLQVGKDYTLAYKNNKAVANAAAGNAPTVTVKGKGNYTGSFEVKFTIENANLRGTNITVECAQAAYNSKKAADYEYKPTVTVKDGKTKLKAGKDYEISYVRNTQADYKSYLESLMGLTTPDEGRPMAIITAKEGSAYTLHGQIEVPLQIYTEKLTKTKLDVKIDPAVYTGGQVKPKVTVTYKGESGNISLVEGVDYTIVYGANTVSGKNKGSITLKGLAPYYGGSVTYKFEIIRKDLKY